MLSPRSPLALTVVGWLAACPGGEGGGEDCGVTVPATWDAPGWEANVAEALALRAQLDVLVGTTMRTAEEGTSVVDDIADLTAPFQAGAPSVEDVTSATYAAITADAFAEFVELAAVPAGTLVDAGGQWAPGATGGIVGTSFRGINEGGLEMRQIVDKGLFAGAGFYNYAVGLTAGAIDVATIDALSAAWGSNITLDPAGEPADSANYTFAMGYHENVVDALIAARAFAANAECDAQRDAAIVDFFRTWETAMFARFSHYANAAATEAAAALDDEGYAGAIHELSEGVGLALGFYGLEDPATGPLAGAARVVTDARIESMMTAIGVDIDDLGASTTGELVTEANFAVPVLDVEELLEAALGVDAAEIAGWRIPTEG